MRLESTPSGGPSALMSLRHAAQEQRRERWGRLLHRAVPLPWAEGRGVGWALPVATSQMETPPPLLAHVVPRQVPRLPRGGAASQPGARLAGAAGHLGGQLERSGAAGAAGAGTRGGAAAAAVAAAARCAQSTAAEGGRAHRPHPGRGGVPGGAAAGGGQQPGGGRSCGCRGEQAPGEWWGGGAERRRAGAAAAARGRREGRARRRGRRARPQGQRGGRAGAASGGLSSC